MTDSTIHLPIDLLNDVKNDLTNGKKISAIKKVRNNSKPKPRGLKEAKFAVERLEAEMGLKPMSQVSPEAQAIRPNTLIRSVKFDLNGGELEVDLDQMEMRALMGLDTLGLNEVARILDLVKILKAFSNGTNIRIDSVSDDATDVSLED